MYNYVTNSKPTNYFHERVQNSKSSWLNWSWIEIAYFYSHYKTLTINMFRFQNGECIKTESYQSTFVDAKDWELIEYWDYDNMQIFLKCH